MPNSVALGQAELYSDDVCLIYLLCIARVSCKSVGMPSTRKSASFCWSAHGATGPSSPWIAIMYGNQIVIISDYHGHRRFLLGMQWSVLGLVDIRWVSRFSYVRKKKKKKIRFIWKSALFWAHFPAPIDWPQSLRVRQNDDFSACLSGKTQSCSYEALEIYVVAYKDQIEKQGIDCAVKGKGDLACMKDFLHKQKMYHGVLSFLLFLIMALFGQFVYNNKYFE